MGLEINPMKFVQSFLTEVLPHRVRVQSDKIIDFPDGTLRLVGATDTSKVVTFEVDGLTAATERVITFPDYNLSLGSGLGTRRNVVLGSVTVALTDALSGSFVDVDGASLAFTLPAITAANIGIFYDFFVSAVSTTVTITAGAADLLVGGVMIHDFDTANTASYFKADGTDDLIITLNGTTKGGKIGSFLRLTAATATRWDVSGVLIGDGTLATPFS